MRPEGSRVARNAWWQISCLCLALTVHAHSQAPTASITGAARDSDGGLVPEASIQGEDAQLRANSRPWDRERWAPRTVPLLTADISHIMGFNATLRGHLRLSGGVEPLNVEPRSVPCGFTDPDDSLEWAVRAPERASYAVAVLYHPGSEDNTGSVFEIRSGNTRLTTAVRRVRDVVWEGGPQDRPSFRRDWFKGVLPLKAGLNRITLRLAKTTPKQSAAARQDLAAPLGIWPKRSLHVLSIELVRPEVLDHLRKREKELRAPTDWMVDGEYGLFISWVPEVYPLYGTTQAWQHYEEAVNRFDVEAFAGAVEETGAAWVVFFTVHGKYYFPGPLQALDHLVPGRTCKRDLVGEIATALGKRHIRMMLYFHPGPSLIEDREWASAAGISPVDDARNNGIMLDIFREVGHRYGRQLWGWVIDGGYAYYLKNMPFEQLAEALKAGNPARVVTYFNWLMPKWHPLGGDFTSNLTYFAALLPPPTPQEYFGPGGPYEGLQPHFNFTMEAEWNPKRPLNGSWLPPVYKQQDLVRYFQQMAARQWPLSINLVITEDVTSRQPFFNPASVELMRSVRRALKGN